MRTIFTHNDSSTELIFRVGATISGQYYPCSECRRLFDTGNLSYDSWGRLRDPNTQVAYTPDTEPVLFLGRGYTGHEHLTVFGLINMNARLYDPALGRFLSPDPYVQAPDFSQNFNRHYYYVNNLLMAKTFAIAGAILIMVEKLFQNGYYEERVQMEQNIKK